MTKYKEYVQKMLKENKAVFDEFRIIHDNYALNQEKFQEEFNRVGENIQEIIREYENRVCANTERGQFIKFSGGLAEKFQQEVRKVFPMIDYIGLKISKPAKADLFSIKRIKLN